MTNLATRDAVKALVAALQSDTALGAFTITDRPARPSALPHIRVGPVSEEPWSTGTSNGAKLSVSLALTSRSGSFSLLVDAADAIAALLETPLTITAATSVVQRLTTTRFAHEPSGNLERATLSVALLIDLGDAP
ncbi:MAG: DUF3168 domain-containing protein [Rhizobiales bacterium]|nr:DUF3168 domain-containing protein [Hyphomicrobiales bacterium]MBO6698684.1 DUF3168 domain-containing protein [Hyphomicrobiales bacterium]MBO6735063.1 DUF3168 domain-containing protein [Hyphomicrobiales bacterium]MBO6911130.1 DUF3168 domain-containing protein [Hyphomicrobiales bacterium]MBO6955641.1 DUF3168 domain-containing protein [Hyphomicrobiales bacterium]